jgi:hypothetical protein
MALLVPCQTYSSWQICWSGMRSCTAPEPPAWSTSAQQPQAEPGAPTFPDPPDAPWAMPTGSGPAVLAALPAAAAAAGCAREIKRLKIERVCGTGGVASVYRAKSAAGCQNTTCPCSVLARTCRLSIDRRLPGLDHQLAVSHRARDLNYLEQHAFIPPSIHHGYRQARTSDRSREAACSA